jgi:CheY-like chemotaxis protein
MELVPQTSEPHEPENKTILVVEDDEGIGAFLVEALNMEVGSHTLLAPDAIKALEIVKTLRPDLVVLDYHLPGMNGLELYEKFQAIKQLREVPTLQMSAHLPKKAKEQHQKMVFLEKPFGLDELLYTIEQLLPH